MKVTDRDREAATNYLFDVGTSDTTYVRDPKEMLVMLLATARQEGRKEALEEAASKAEDHCRHATRLCVDSVEEPCSACLSARDIRALADKEEG